MLWDAPERPSGASQMLRFAFGLIFGGGNAPDGGSRPPRGASPMPQQQRAASSTSNAATAADGDDDGADDMVPYSELQAAMDMWRDALAAKQRASEVIVGAGGGKWDGVCVW